MEPITASIATVDNAIKALKFTMARIDDWQKVGPEGIALKNECDRFDDIIEDLLNKPDLPISDELNSAHTTLVATNTLIIDFLNQDSRRDRSFLDAVGWQFQRAFLSNTHRDTFKLTTAKLEKHKEEFTKILKFTRIMDTPTVYWYKNSMVNDDCFKFWKKIGGQDLIASSWTQFTATYQREHNNNEEWDGDLMERIRRVACSGSEDTQLSIAGFISLTNKCGFPLNYDMLPKLIDSHAMVSAQTRMEVARMINELITYYSTQEMRDLLVSIFTWYNGCKPEKKQARANDWAHAILENRKKPMDQWNDDDKFAEKVDMARRTYSFFFQRYMVVFKIGQLSKEMFAEVDFPGKARMCEFINNVKPLDHANYHIVIGGKAKDWESKQPKLYTFLNEYIEDDNKAKAKKEEEEELMRQDAAATAQALEPINDEAVVPSLGVAESASSQDTKV